MGDRPDPAYGNRLTAAIDYAITPLSAHPGAEARDIDPTRPVDGPTGCNFMVTASSMAICVTISGKGADR
jgi:hypothetical protein